MAIKVRNKQEYITKLQVQINEVINKQATVNDLSPFLIISSGMSFGELALLSKSPRSGTVLTLTDCFFAMISAESFEKLLMKEKAMRITKNIVFLRKVPYIQNSLIHDIHSLFLLCNER